MELSLTNTIETYGNGGRIQLVCIDGCVYILSMADDDVFTIAMLRDIIRLSKLYDICLLVDTESKQEQIRSVLDKRWSMDYHNADGIMFAFHYLKEI